MIKESDLVNLTDVMFGNKWVSVLEPRIINNQLVFKGYRKSSNERMMFKQVVVKTPLAEIQGVILSDGEEMPAETIQDLPEIHFQVLGL